MNVFHDFLNRTLFGEFELSVVDRKTRELVDFYSEKNIIVLDSQETVIHAISDTSSLYVINQIKIGDDVGSDVTDTGNPNITFTNNSPSNDTITRDGGSWINDGFLDQMSITVTGSTNNNGTYTIQSVSDLTLTLVESGVLVNEGPSTAPSITGTPSPDNPAPPIETYNESTMSVVYATTTPLTVGYNSPTSVVFNKTIVGADVIAAWPGEQTKIITSAALHAGSGKVFAYKRFPQKSISSLVDIIINWTISY